MKRRKGRGKWSVVCALLVVGALALFVAANSSPSMNPQGDLIKKLGPEEEEGEVSGEMIDASGLWRYVVMNGSATVMGCVVRPQGDLTIPGELDGYTVTGIGHEAFQHCWGLTSVTIPDSVTSIGHEAFFWSELTSVNIPDGVTSIGEWAFRGCASLTSIHIPASVTNIGTAAFAGCPFTSFSVSPDNPTYAVIQGALVDKQERTLVSLPYAKEEAYTVPDGILHIGNAAFTNCIGLTSVTIPDGVLSIGAGAFEYTGLTGVTIPASVISIGANPFIGCDDLSYIDVSPNNPIFQQLDGVLLDKQQRRLVSYPKTRAGAYTIPEGVQLIGNVAFGYCHDLTGVTIPDSVTTIDDGAFWTCDGLTSVILPNSVTSIGDHAFGSCYGLVSVAIPDSVTSIGDGAFYGCFELTNVNLPNSVTSIGDSVFAWCHSLTDVDIPKSVTSIGNRAFFECIALTGVAIPASVTHIGEFAFYVQIDEIAEYILNDKVTLRVTQGSHAEQYAKEHGIPFVYSE